MVCQQHHGFGVVWASWGPVAAARWCACKISVAAVATGKHAEADLHKTLLPQHRLVLYNQNAMRSGCSICSCCWGMLVVMQLMARRGALPLLLLHGMALSRAADTVLLLIDCVPKDCVRPQNMQKHCVALWQGVYPCCQDCVTHSPLPSMCHHPPQYRVCGMSQIHTSGILPPRTDHQAGLTGLQCNAEPCGCHHFPRHWQICHPCIQYCTTHAAQPDAKDACHYCVTTCLFVTVRATMVCCGAATGHDRARDPHCAPCAAEETRLNRSSRQCQVARN
jgi:hypothetical protein